MRCCFSSRRSAPSSAATASANDALKCFTCSRLSSCSSGSPFGSSQHVDQLAADRDLGRLGLAAAAVDERARRRDAQPVLQKPLARVHGDARPPVRRALLNAVTPGQREQLRAQHAAPDRRPAAPGVRSAARCARSRRRTAARTAPARRRRRARTRTRDKDRRHAGDPTSVRSTVRRRRSAARASSAANSSRASHSLRHVRRGFVQRDVETGLPAGQRRKLAAPRGAQAGPETRARTNRRHATDHRREARGRTRAAA